MKKRIAVIFEDFLHIQLGVFTAAINRAKHLAQVADYDIDVYMLEVYDGCIMQRLRRSHHVTERPDIVTRDGVTIHMIWFKRDWRDSVKHRLLHREPSHFIQFLKETARRFEGYDLITAHDRMGGEIAEEAGRLFGIPWYITWHGGNSVTVMLEDAVLRRIATRLLEGATCNFMVSRGLVDIMREFTPTFRHEVLLNGADESFRRMSDTERIALRERYGVPKNVPVVAFVGRFEPVKNVLMLPEIFETIAHKYGMPIQFWAIGNGVLLPKTQQLMAQRQDVSCTFPGLRPHNELPLLMNCIDVLVLPSSLEGLPLVTIEALSCGAHVVASDVAGTAEAVGKENTFTLDDRFIDRLTDRAVAMLRGKVEQQLPPEVSWQATAIKENKIYRRAMWLDGRSTNEKQFT